MSYENEPVRVEINGKEYALLFCSRSRGSADDYAKKRKARGRKVKVKALWCVIEKEG